MGRKNEGGRRRRKRTGAKGDDDDDVEEEMQKKSGFGCNIFNIIKMIEEKITINITQDKENS